VKEFKNKLALLTNATNEGFNENFINRLNYSYKKKALTINEKTIVEIFFLRKTFTWE